METILTARVDALFRYLDPCFGGMRPLGDNGQGSWAMGLEKQKLGEGSDLGLRV